MITEFASNRNIGSSDGSPFEYLPSQSKLKITKNSNRLYFHLFSDILFNNCYRDTVLEQTFNDCETFVNFHTEMCTIDDNDNLNKAKKKIYWWTSNLPNLNLLKKNYDRRISLFRISPIWHKISLKLPIRALYIGPKLFALQTLKNNLKYKLKIKNVHFGQVFYHLT